MNLDTIILSVQRQFGDESDAQITRSDIIRWANEAQIDIVRKTDSLQVHAETDAVANDGSYSLPTGHVRIRRVTFNDYKLERTELEKLDDIYSNPEKIESSTPQYYYVWGNKLFLFPKPSSEGTGNLDVYYNKMPAELVGGSDVPEIPVHMHDDIGRFSLARAKELNEDDGKAQAVMMDYEARIALSKDESNNPEIDSYPSVRDIDNLGYPSSWTGYGAI